MKSISVSSIVRLTVWRYASIRLTVVAAALLLICCPAIGQTISSGVLQIAPPTKSGSTVVPIQTPEQVISRPLRTLVDAVRGEQTVRTRNGIGFRTVNILAEDEVWLVSARHQNQRKLSVQRLVDGQWLNASTFELSDAHATDQQKTTVVYVHGNRTDDQYARSRGLQFYENVFNGQARSGPVRFVIFAWKSERERIRPTADFNVKLDRAVELGPAFASFLAQFHDRRIVLTGFSLGGQVILSSLAQMQSQESLLGSKEGRYQVALITPALKAEDSLNSVASLPQNSVAAKTVVFINQKDNAIRAAMLIAKATSRKAAVTLEQIAGQLGAVAEINPVVIEDMTLDVTSCHSVTKYSAKSLRLQMVVNEMASAFRGSFEQVGEELVDGFDSICPKCEALQSHSTVEVAEQIGEVQAK